jgi:hypothetical protein
MTPPRLTVPLCRISSRSFRKEILSLTAASRTQLPPRCRFGTLGTLPLLQNRLRLRRPTFTRRGRINVRRRFPTAVQQQQHQQLLKAVTILMGQVSSVVHFFRKNVATCLLFCCLIRAVGFAPGMVL